MRHLSILAVLFVLAFPVKAQLVQSAVIPESVLIIPTKVHTLTLPKPVTTGNFLIAFMRNCNGATDPTQPFADSLPNVWKDASIYHDKWYVEAAIGGTETLTFTSAQPSYCQPILAEFNGSWTLDVISHPLYLDNVSEGKSYPIAPSGPGELILGFGTGDCGCALGRGPVTTPGTGFTFAAFSAPLYIEYLPQQAAAPIEATDFNSFPIDTIISVAAFKPNSGCKA